MAKPGAQGTYYKLIERKMDAAPENVHSLLSLDPGRASFSLTLWCALFPFLAD